MKYRKEIDGLRALAIVPVILFHSGSKTFSGGFVGVDIFFVISGYLITSIIVAELEQGTYSLLNFYERRARRILPALFFMMICTLPFAWMWMPPLDLISFSESLAATSLFSSNIYFWKTSGYFDAASELKPLLHTWSLAVEEQFYFLFPILLIITWNLGKKWIISSLLIMGFTSLFLAQWGSTAHPTSTFYLLPTRCFELLIGSLISFFYNQNTSRARQSTCQLGSLFGIALILYAIFLFDIDTPLPSLYSLVPTIGAALIILFANDRNLVGFLLSRKLIVGIGLISYSTYLWHQPLLAFARLRVSGNLEPPFPLLLCLCSLALGFLSWHYIENPFRKKGGLSRKKIFFFCTFFIILFVSIGVICRKQTGFEYRYPLIKNITSRGADMLLNGNNCFLLKTDVTTFQEEKCLSDLTSKKFKVLLIGDSHAASLYGELENYLLNHDVSLSMLTAAYCLPVVESFPIKNTFSATSRCEEINRKANALIKENNFDLILISSYILDRGFNPKTKTSYATYYRDYLSKIEEINNISKVAVIGEFIVWNGSLPNLIGKEILINSLSNVEDLPKYSFNGLDKQLFSTEQILKKDFKKLNIQYISIVDELCNKEGCIRYVDTDNGKKLISIDYGHLGVDGSQYISDNIVGPRVIKILNNIHSKNF